MLGQIDFSSRGPTSTGGAVNNDNRIKPDIMAPGVRIHGAASQDPGYAAVNVCTMYFPAGQTLYTWSSGTSHSTPAVAGATARLDLDEDDQVAIECDQVDLAEA